MKRIVITICIIALSVSAVAGPIKYPPPEAGIKPWITIIVVWLRGRYGWMSGPH